MRRASILIFGLLVGQVTAVPAFAQLSGIGVGLGLGMGWGGYGGFGFGGGTVEGNYLLGMSQVVRSEGEYNYYSSLANINNEEAYGKFLDNQKKWQQNYFQMKEERQRLAVQQREINRQRNEAAAQRRASAPPVQHGLGQSSYDRLTGRINWPQALQAREFDVPRKEIDQLFELRARTAGGVDIAANVRTATDQMLSRLRSDIEKLPAQQFIAARKFLDAVDYTARFESPHEIQPVENLPPAPGA
jgi:hypothetical protein